MYKNLNLAKDELTKSTYQLLGWALIACVDLALVYSCLGILRREELVELVGGFGFIIPQY